MVRINFLAIFLSRGGAMNWSTERDALIAETMAFVQSVTGKRPDGTAEAVSVGPVSVATAPIDSSGATAPIDSSGSSYTRVEQTGKLPPGTVLPRSEIRKELQTRVAAFQAHQHRFQREREAYFNSVLTKARLPKALSTLEAEPKVPPI
jgi:hypothetical protein